MSAEPSALLVVANSGRAIAESAAAGGYEVTVLDAFCDDDTRCVASCTQITMNHYGLETGPLRAAVERCIGQLGSSGLIYGAGLEQAPATLSWLAQRVPLLGNAPAVLDRLLNPPSFFGLLDELDIDYPEVRFKPPPGVDATQWLVKAAGSSGGLQVRGWHEAGRRPEGPHYFQRFVEGPVMSVLFLADGREFRIVGYNRNLSTDLGGEGSFLYAGVLARARLRPSQRSLVEHYCGQLVSALGLRGMNNLDFVLQGDRVCLLELNPRPSASMGLYESDCPGGCVKCHVRACLGELMTVSVDSRAGVSGQHVLYARRDMTVPRGLRWPAWIKDRPSGGARISRGAPICTVLASAASTAAVERQLGERTQVALRLLEGGVAPDRTGFV
jgi:predicted ATP-grasp superfamily ATP-dependent carboligase